MENVAEAGEKSFEWTISAAVGARLIAPLGVGQDGVVEIEDLPANCQGERLRFGVANCA